MPEYDEEFEPFPQALPGKKGLGWKVADTGNISGSCSPSTKELFVPTGGACEKCGHDHAFAVRRHEMGHAKWTPARGHLKIEQINDKDPGTIDPDAAQVVEDHRLGILLKNAGVPDHLTVCTEDKTRLKDAFETWSLEKRLYYGVATLAYPKDWSQFLEVLRDVDWSKFPGEDFYSYIYQLEGVKNTLQHRPKTTGYGTDYIDLPTFDDTLRAAQYLTSLVEAEKRKAESEYKKEMRRKAKEAMAKKAKAEAERMSARAKEKSKQAGRGEVRETMKKLLDGTAGSKGSSGGRGKHDIWAPMEVNDIPKPDTLPGRLLSRHRASDEGAFVRSMHRFVTDGKIFGTKTTKPGGTILLDGSGSMAWNEEDMWQVLQHCPGAQIAVYEGNHGAGELRILARDGRVCTREMASYRKWGGNDVDGPALEWLCEQEGPRIWVCDGGVIAPFGHQSAANAQCAAYCKLGDVFWINPAPYEHTLAGFKAQVTGCGFGQGLTDAIVAHLKRNGAIYVA